MRHGVLKKSLMQRLLEATVRWKFAPRDWWFGLYWERDGDSLSIYVILPPFSLPCFPLVVRLSSPHIFPAALLAERQFTLMVADDLGTPPYPNSLRGSPPVRTGQKFDYSLPFFEQADAIDAIIAGAENVGKNGLTRRPPGE